MVFDRKAYMKEYMKKWYQEHKIEENIKSREYHQLHKEECNKNNREHYYNHKEEYQAHNKKWIQEHPGYNRKKLRAHKIQALEEIAKHHNTEVKCWKCGEKRLWVLTISHVNQDGAEERKQHGKDSTRLYRRILSKERTCEDLQIECWNCNCCLGCYNKYPDEIDEEEFIQGI